jgi:EmrB/QacA subfamily drug resistance transporter
MIGPQRPPCDVAAIRARPCGDAGPPAAAGWILAATILGSGMAFIDGTVVNVALPAIQQGLGATASATQWVVNVYTLMLGALVLVGGAAGDRFGRRRVFLAGIAVFALASAGCAAAPGSASLIAARAAQGMGGALMVPGSLALIAASFPEAERGRAIGTWAGAGALTTALGPVLGGWLVEVWSWRAVFLLNLPLAAAASWMTLRHVPESRDAEAPPLDWIGAAAATVALGALTYAAVAAGESGPWSAAVLVPAAVGVAVAAGFLRHEARAAHPMVPLGLFRSATFSGANALTLLLYAALTGALFLLPFELIQLRGYSPAEAGAAFLPFSLLMGLLSRVSGGLSQRFGARGPLVLGPAVAALGFALLGLSAGRDWSFWWSVLPGMVVLGLGMTTTVAPLTTAVMEAADERHAGAASGINNAVARVAGLLAVAVLGTAALAVQASALDRRLADMGLAPEARAAVAEARPGFAAPPPVEGLSGAERRAVSAASGDAFLVAYRAMMLTCAGLALGAAAVAAGTIRPDRRPSPRAAPTERERPA